MEARAATRGWLWQYRRRCRCQRRLGRLGTSHVWPATRPGHRRLKANPGVRLGWHQFTVVQAPHQPRCEAALVEDVVAGKSRRRLTAADRSVADRALRNGPPWGGQRERRKFRVVAVARGGWCPGQLFPLRCGEFLYPALFIRIARRLGLRLSSSHRYTPGV